MWILARRGAIPGSYDISPRNRGGSSEDWNNGEVGTTKNSDRGEKFSRSGKLLPEVCGGVLQDG